MPTRGPTARATACSRFGQVDKLETTAATFGGLKGRETLANGTSNTTPWKLRMFVAWDARHRNLISIFAIFSPAAAAAPPTALDSFLTSSTSLYKRLRISIRQRSPTGVTEMTS